MKNKNIPKLEVLATLQGKLGLGLADSALQSQDDLLGSLGLLVEDGLRLTTITGLLAVITTLTLGEQRGLYFERKKKRYGLSDLISDMRTVGGRGLIKAYLASLVLGDLVLGVLLALLALAVCPAGFRDVDLI